MHTRKIIRLHEKGSEAIGMEGAKWSFFYLA